MEPLTERQIRASFVNCSKGEAGRINLPRDLAETRWGQLDHLGWRDPQSRTRGYLVASYDGRPVGVVLRASETGVGARRSMCSLCLTTQSGGVSLLVAQRAGRAGRQGHSVGTYICADLACSDRVRGRRRADGPIVYETLTTEQQVARLEDNRDAFIARVLRQDR